MTRPRKNATPAKVQFWTDAPVKAEFEAAAARARLTLTDWMIQRLSKAAKREGGIDVR